VNLALTQSDPDSFVDADIMYERLRRIAQAWGYTLAAQDSVPDIWLVGTPNTPMHPSDTLPTMERLLRLVERS
jgi:hypothetical protein